MHTLIIGSNNLTKVVEKDKAIACLGNHFLGFNISDTVGYYKGAFENSINVLIAGEESAKVNAVTKELCNQLNQESIMVWYPDGTYSFIN